MTQKTKRKKMKLLFTFFVVVFFGFVSILPLQVSGIWYGSLTLSVSAPTFSDVSRPITVKATTNIYSYIKIYVDGDLKKTGWGTSLLYTFTAVSYLKKYKIDVTATSYEYFPPQTVSRTRYTRLQFDPGATSQDADLWYDRAQDYARSPGSTKVWDVAMEIMEFSWGSTPVNAPETAIEGILNFAEDYLTYFYSDDSDSLTAAEVANLFNGFDGSTDDVNTFPLSRYLDCSDMAAFISGVAISIGISSRIVSLSDYGAEDDTRIMNNYQHMFAELYGITHGNNNGWFLIDPARSNHQVFSSYTPVTTVKSSYANTDGNVERLWIIWGMTSSGWGLSVPDNQRTTSWYGNYVSWPKAPNNYKYSNNPWGIIVEQNP